MAPPGNTKHTGGLLRKALVVFEVSLEATGSVEELVTMFELPLFCGLCSRCFVIEG